MAKSVSFSSVLEKNHGLILFRFSASAEKSRCRKWKPIQSPPKQTNNTLLPLHMENKRKSHKWLLKKITGFPLKWLVTLTTGLALPRSLWQVTGNPYLISEPQACIQDLDCIRTYGNKISALLLMRCTKTCSSSCS